MSFLVSFGRPSCLLEAPLSLAMTRNHLLSLASGFACVNAAVGEVLRRRGEAFLGRSICSLTATQPTRALLFIKPSSSSPPLLPASLSSIARTHAKRFCSQASSREAASTVEPTLQKSSSCYAAGRPDLLHGKRNPHVVLLGTGWAAVHFLKGLDISKYNVSVVSPRNYFTFTPLLPSVCSGTLTPIACIEPIRSFSKRNSANKQASMDFFEATCQHVDLANRQVECSNKSNLQFKLNYDYLVIAVGAETNTFGIKGVKEYAYFLKEVEHAQAIRKQVMNSFETAALPVVTPEERNRLLHFAIVGGGPTGIETAAEFADFIKDDMAKYFPHLIPHVQITLIEALNKVLPMYSERVSRYTVDTFRKLLNIQLLLEHTVTEITDRAIILEDNSSQGAGKIKELPYGFVLWASGVAQVPLCKRLLGQIPQQTGNRVLKVNHQLRVLGTENVYAMGDCSWMEPPTLEAAASELFSRAGTSPDGPSTKWLAANASKLMTCFPQISTQKWDFKKQPSESFTEAGFKEYLAKIDAAFRPPSPTAQNAKQAGSYLARSFSKHLTPESKLVAPAFVEQWRGALAYVGASRAVGALPMGDMLGGFYSLPFWKLMYASMLLTWRSRAICLFDWARTKCTGRDVGRDHTFF